MDNNTTLHVIPRRKTSATYRTAENLRKVVDFLSTSGPVPITDICALLGQKVSGARKYMLTLAESHVVTVGSAIVAGHRVCVYELIDESDVVARFLKSLLDPAQAPRHTPVRAARAQYEPLLPGTRIHLAADDDELFQRKPQNVKVEVKRDPFDALFFGTPKVAA